jgi:acetyl esterase/lipase
MKTRNIISNESESALDVHTKERDIFIPLTISEAAQDMLWKMQKLQPWKRQFPAPNDFDAWRDILREGIEALAVEGNPNQIAVEDNKVTVMETRMGDVDVLDIRPLDWINNGKVLVFAHGGGFTINSARSTLTKTAPMCRVSGLRVISVDYTTAPFANWKKIQQQLVSVFKALLDEGYTMKDIGIYGASSGGGLAVSTVLNLLEADMGMPAATVLWSPWVDLGNEGDTMHTLKNFEPRMSYENTLKTSALAYADGLDLKDPRVSPIYADFSNGFPPTLIQDGTKTILLSGSVRLYQKLDAKGVSATFDIYEGMVHIFQQFLIPEAQIAIRKSAAFLNRYLNQCP